MKLSNKTFFCTKKSTLKKAVCVTLSIMLCFASVCFPISTNITTTEAFAAENSQEEQILFSHLFFTNNEDVEKITGYFDSEILNNSALRFDKVDINKLTEQLSLNTTYDETLCILKYLFIINEYVEDEKINEATTGTSLSESSGGMLSKIPIYKPGAQLLWNKDTVHNDATTTIAKDYFSNTNAAKIGKYNREVDIKYSSGVGAITGSSNQYIHFNQYATGSDDSRDYAAATWFVACELAWNKKQKENAYMYLGYALHPLQDKEAHGQIGRGKPVPQHIVSYTAGDNIKHADDVTGWEWTNSSRNALKKVSGSKKRYNAAVSVTRKYLSKYAKILK